MRTISTVMVNIVGQMGECSMVNGLITKWKDKEHLHGVMEEDTMDNT